MIVQATNTGGDLGSNQFDLAIPGGGVGIYNACTDEYNAPSSGWGAQYGGISTDTCSSFPEALQSGCSFRFDWFEGADNPDVEFEQVACPAEITKKTGCVRSDDGSADVASASSSAVASSSAAVQSSSSSAATSSASAQAKVAASSAASEAAPSAYSSAISSADAATSSAVVPAPSASSSVAGSAQPTTGSDDANCNVQYAYEYDM